MLSLLAGRVFEFRTSLRFTLLRGVAFTLTLAFAFGRLMLTGLFALAFAFLLTLAFLLLFALALSFAFLFLGGLFGLFSLLFEEALVLRFSAGSSGITVSGVSPSLAARLMSIATV